MTPATYAANFSKVCDTASKFLSDEHRKHVIDRAGFSLTFFQSGASTSDAALRTVCIEAAYRELRAAAKELNYYGNFVVTGWIPVTF